ncbi:MAG: rRNA pseudouridine synthase [Alphaproteobacteria bacterium]|nr:rRNA pseudouridine synthase [Alphaproteobacteria bacterium]
MTEQDDNAAGPEGDRIAKVLARAGVASRRDAEKMIAEGRVTVDGTKLTTPAVKVPPGAIIQVDGQVIAGAEPTRLWRYHKPIGLVTTHKDEKGRPTVFEHLPPGLPRVISVGRLDLNSEGLLLLTNDGALARRLELPETGWTRRYRVRFFGTIAQGELDRLSGGVTIDGVRYGPIEATLERSTGQNSWASVALKEGKNREVRRVFEHFGLRVSRLIRTAYGPFQLGDLAEGQAAEVSGKVIKEQLGLSRNPNRSAGPRPAPAPRPVPANAPSRPAAAAPAKGRKRQQTATERNAHLARARRPDRPKQPPRKR